MYFSAKKNKKNTKLNDGMFKRVQYLVCVQSFVLEEEVCRVANISLSVLEACRRGRFPLVTFDLTSIEYRTVEG